MIYLFFLDDPCSIIHNATLVQKIRATHRLSYSLLWTTWKYSGVKKYLPYSWFFQFFAYFTHMIQLIK